MFAKIVGPGVVSGTTRPVRSVPFGRICRWPHPRSRIKWSRWTRSPTRRKISRAIPPARMRTRARRPGTKTARRIWARRCHVRRRTYHHGHFRQRRWRSVHPKRWHRVSGWSPRQSRRHRLFSTVRHPRHRRPFSTARRRSPRRPRGSRSSTTSRSSNRSSHPSRWSHPTLTKSVAKSR